MITAEPDITATRLQEGDRFFILACDGVWDCLTNQQAVRHTTLLLPVLLRRGLFWWCSSLLL